MAEILLVVFVVAVVMAACYFQDENVGYYAAAADMQMLGYTDFEIEEELGPPP